MASPETFTIDDDENAVMSCDNKSIETICSEPLSLSVTTTTTTTTESDIDASKSELIVDKSLVMNSIISSDEDDDDADDDDDHKLDEKISEIDLSDCKVDEKFIQLESEITSSEDEQLCKLCKNKFNSPKILSCLHVFCESCIKILVIDNSSDTSKPEDCVICPICKQQTKLGENGVSSLYPNFIYTNILDLSSIDPSLLACTSCKSKETAISRCTDCANFLCASCDNAHQYMRCFEDHTVVQLKDMRESVEKITIHKPLYCVLHCTENLKYFCFNCQMPICNDCLLSEHKGAEHHYEIISEAEKRMKNEVQGLMLEARTKFEYCEQASNNLETSLNDLQRQHDSAKGLIVETYQKLQSMLDKAYEDSLKELDGLHSERELKIMDLYHNVEESAQRIETACNFTKTVLDQANGPEFLSLKKIITSQFLNLINTIPKADINYSLKFVTNANKLDNMRDAFGQICTETTCSLSPKESTPPPTLPGMPPLLSNKSVQNGIGNNSQGTLTGSVTASSPISLPTSMQSSFDGDISGIGGSSFVLPQNVLTPDSTTSQIPPAVAPPATNIFPQVPNVPNTAALSGLTSIAEYNLHRLANIAETTTDIADPIVSANANPSSQFTIADLISGDQNAFNSFQAIAKIGLSNPDFGPPPQRALQSTTPVSLLPDFSNPMAASVSPLAHTNGITGLNDEMFGNPFQQPMNVSGRTKATSMQIRCKFGSLGPSKGQFNAPHGFCLGLDEEIIVADTNNHRIEIFEKNGNFKFQFGVPGKDEGQLWYPRKVAVMRTNSRFVVCDRGNERSRMQIFTKSGHFMKKIAIRYIDIVAGLAVTNEGHIVAVDSVSPTVFIISEEGDLLHWFDCSDFMREPSDIAVNGNDFYVCDFKGHCVAVFSNDGKFQYRIGNEKITCFPNGIDISDAGDVLIGDSHGNRFHVACYSRKGVLQSEFECPHVKVSRCCGLKITSEGYVVTLAKNNHHVLVLNTLYIQ